jgi:hypothetical protein
VRPVNASGAKVVDRVQSIISTSTFTLRQAFTGAEISTDAIRSAGFNGWTDYTSTPDASEQVEEDDDVLSKVRIIRLIYELSRFFFAMSVFVVSLF